jgi:hypothetical protein
VLEHPDDLLERGLTDDETVTLIRSGRDAGDPAPWGQVVKLTAVCRRLHVRTATLERLVKRGRRYIISALLALAGMTGTGAKFALDRAAERAVEADRQAEMRRQIDELRELVTHRFRD